jgi:FKBP-type peptidyl-prolyl cis-trans isomerase
MIARVSLTASLIALCAVAFADSTAAPTPVKGLKSVVLPSGLEYYDIKKGTGAEAKSGKTVKVHYTGWLTDGKKFDSSVDRHEPFEFSLGAHQVIAGWDEGVSGMKVGGRRQLHIPAKLGYGATGTPGGPIPPNADLVFDVALIDVK